MSFYWLGIGCAGRRHEKQPGKHAHNSSLSGALGRFSYFKVLCIDVLVHLGARRARKPRVSVAALYHDFD